VIADKARRQKVILELVKTRAIHTQEELVGALRQLDHPVTQATVSRDIRELGLSREPGPAGSRYAVRSGIGIHMAHVLRDFITAVDAVQFIAIVHTPPGTANLVAFAIDRSDWPEVLGTVAGDDTVLVVAADIRGRKLVEQRLLAGELDVAEAAARSGAQAPL
jgi:transcriptional regulator of arginine metabolism